MQRYFAKSKDSNQFILEDTDYHHIKNVMRNHIGDQIEVVYDTVVYICKITNLNPVTLEITDTLIQNSEMNINVTVALSLVNEQKFDLIIQKLTELGVSNIIPIKTERSIVKLDAKKIPKKIERWQMICKEASEQSKRIKIPKVHNIISLKELTNVENNLKLICSLSENTKPLKEYLKQDTKEVLFVIGPEGGFSSQEEKMLLANNFLPVSLGKRVMRVETAAIYVASIINYICEG